MRHRGPRACSHCGSPAKNNPCYDRIDREKFYRTSGADAPCECDEYREGENARERRAWRNTLVVSFLTLVIGALVIIAINHPEWLGL